ncbi:hypothetical protein ACLESO_44645 [Pyxidicoccus sp. 3LG]
MMTAAVPDFIPLHEWAKFRLIHGIRTHQPLEAARDVRHVAWLAYRTDTLLGAMIATAILGFEGKAHASMKDPPPEWKPQSPEENRRMRAVLWASITFSNIAAPPEVARKARSCGSGISRCLGLSEATSLGRYLRPVASNAYAAAYTTLAEDIASAPCSTSLVPTLWERGATIDDHPPADSNMPDQPEWMRKLPRRYAGRHIAGILLGLSTQNIDLLKQLREAPSAPTATDAAP